MDWADAFGFQSGRDGYSRFNDATREQIEDMLANIHIRRRSTTAVDTKLNLTGQSNIDHYLISLYNGDGGTTTEDNLESIFTGNLDYNVHPLALAVAAPFHFFLRFENRDNHEWSAVEFNDLRILDSRPLCLFMDVDDMMSTPKIGLVPQTTQAGDFICELYGDPRVFVFRPITAKGESGGSLPNDHFAVVLCSKRRDPG